MKVCKTKWNPQKYAYKIFLVFTLFINFMFVLTVIEANRPNINGWIKLLLSSAAGASITSSQVMIISSKIPND